MLLHITSTYSGCGDTPPARGFNEVYYPGEIEWLTERQRRQEGIYVEDDTWEEISALIAQHKLEEVIGQS